MTEFMEVLQIGSDDMDKKCAMCTEQGKDAAAKSICQECKEMFCENCSVYHRSQKYAMSHNLLEIVEETALRESNNKSEKQCEICVFQDKKADAVMFCEQCKELLCKACSSIHLSQKMTKSHRQIHVEQIEPADKMLCEPCSESGRSIQAVKCCKICEEALCEKCVLAHKLQKATKSHKLVDGTKFSIDQKSDKICEPCNKNGKNISAFRVCIDCQELLCDACATMHKTLKATKYHKLIDAIIIPTTLCEPCLEKGENVASDKICAECEETLCFSCIVQHKAQKATKNHRLEDLKLCLFDIKLCDPCAKDKNEKIAIKYCEECDEFYCLKCTEMHSVLKATRKHTLVELKRAQNAERTTASHEKEESSLFQGDAKNSCMELRNPLQRDIMIDSRPRQPVASDETSDSITLHWEMQGGLKVSRCFEIRYKEKGKQWQHHSENTDKNAIRIGNLTAETSYTFQVRAITNNEEGPYSPESDEICTKSELEKRITPGKPVASDVKSDSIELHWKAARSSSNSSNYQIRYKEKGKKWRFYNENPERTTVTLFNLQAETTYIFQVRVITDEDEGPYSPESDEIQTKASLASKLLSFCSKVDGGPPEVYQLYSTENKNARNEQAKTRTFEIGRPPILIQKEKTILLVGETGSGKSTLVDGIINYVTGVSWKDPYRFTVVDLEKEEKNKIQAVSQTEWITCYTINQEEGSRLNYGLKIIDTPGFGNTRGLDRDDEIVRQLKELFSATGEKGVVYMDAVFFLIKASDARLTARQNYIFMSIQSLFGKDIEKNICMLIIFADSKNPPVLAAMKAAELPFSSWYVFNNSGLFASNDDSQSSFAQMYWEMGNKSFQTLFDTLEKLPTKCLQQTQQVFQERERIKIISQRLQPQYNAGLNKFSELRIEKDILSKHEKDILDSVNFEYEVEETRQVKTECPPGRNAIICLECHDTCQEDCPYADENVKANCGVMRNGNCTVCDQNVLGNCMLKNLTHFRIKNSK